MVELDRSIFYHIPKTGGSWVNTVLQSICKPANVIKGHLMEDEYPKKDKKAFSFVRHPVSWYISSFFYGSGGAWVPAQYKKHCRPIDFKFDRYVEMMCETNPGWISNYVKEKCKNIDYIGRFENLSADLIMILEYCHEEYTGGKMMYFASENVGNYAISIDKNTQLMIQKSESFLMDVFYSYARNDIFTPKVVFNDGTW